jgi:tRNA G10  N-methylase Trm11
MKSLPDQSVDCFICDLPYGQLTSKKASKPVVNLKTGKPMPLNTYDGNCSWDIKIDMVEFWKQVKRLCRDDHTPVLMFCNTKFGVDLIVSNPSWFRYDLVWNKGGGAGFLMANKMPLRQHEMVYVFSKKGSTYIRKDLNHCVGSVITVTKNRGKDKHPTEKPTDLYRWLLERYCPAGGTVLDPTAGSCNSVFTAKELGLHGIGIEMDRGFFYKALCVLLRSTKSPTS